MISIRHLILVLLLAVRRCFSSAPLSLIQGHISTIYYFGTAVPPKIIPWYSRRVSNYLQSLMMSNDEAVIFTAASREAIDLLNWSPDRLKQYNSADFPGTFEETFENRTLSLNATDYDHRISEGTYLINFI